MLVHSSLVVTVALASPLPPFWAWTAATVLAVVVECAMDVLDGRGGVLQHQVVRVRHAAVGRAAL